MHSVRLVTEFIWRALKGSELVEALEDENLEEFVEPCSAIYMWKKNLHATSLAIKDAQTMVDWISRQVDSPSGVVSDKSVGQFLWVSRLELRSNSLPRRQRELLQNWATERRHRKWLTQYVSLLEAQTPALYVGETGNLTKRTKDHLRGHTNFSNRIEGLIAWEELSLYYFSLGKATDSSSEIRKIVEYLTNSLVIGGFTQRPG